MCIAEGSFAAVQKQSKLQVRSYASLGILLAYDSLLRPMPGSDDEDDGDTAKGLLQNILERVSNGEACHKFMSC